jgi:hypothetical protein
LQDFGTARWQLLVDATSSLARPKARRSATNRLEQSHMEFAPQRNKAHAGKRQRRAAGPRARRPF